MFGGGVEPLNADPPELDDNGQIVEGVPSDPLGKGEAERVSAELEDADHATTESAPTDATAAESRPASTGSPTGSAAESETEPRETENSGSQTGKTIAQEPEATTGFADSGF
ncbi:hypothetical protein ACFFQF_11895 [Haladaptatus pallidirubidus]|uniref:Uncharacterized protein n=1 Tax=Haladaptatus pallidirubidus TaxID=1008152 RepID=A0AAV3UDT6_9EURY|nr:hypothetical protein [Haladaptatus pallidirubidus]